MAGIDDLILGLLSWLGQMDNDTSVITFENIVSGSTIITGTATPTTTTAAVGSSNLASGFVGATTIPGTAFAVTGASVTAHDGTTSTGSEDAGSSIGLIAGAAVGAVVIGSSLLM